MQIRLFEPEDTEQIAWLFHNTVRKVNIKNYSKRQVVAWSPEDVYFRDWQTVCSRYTYVAEKDNKIFGFGELEPNGNIDYFYVHHQHQRQGVGSEIYRAIETKARELNLTSLYAEASITAKTFFISRGFKVIKQQQVICRQEKFINYLVVKVLSY